MKKLTCALAFSLLSIFHFAKAQDHDHGSPHKGIVQTAGDYHIEMVMKGNQMMIYLLDENEKTIKPAANIKGTVTTQYEKTSSVVTLTPMAPDHYTATVKDMNMKSCLVAFTIGDKKASATFKHDDMKGMEMKGMDMKKSEDNHQH